MTWRYEDGGPDRRQLVPGSLGVGPDDRLVVTTRVAPAATMVVTDEQGGYFLLRHTAGDDSVAIVERFDPVTLEPIISSPELPGGPVWPGGVGVARDGAIHVVFGDHAHRLGPDLVPTASVRLPRHRPYNSFVTLADGHLVTKDFGGSRPGAPVAAGEREPCELLVLDPDDLSIVARLELPEASIARLSADRDAVYVVGDTHLFRVGWDGSRLSLDDGFTARYRTIEGQTYGWDCVLAAGAAWFLDDGEGSDAYDGTLRGHGVATTPLHLVRVDLASGEVRLTEVCGRPGGLIANPPVVDEIRRVVVGYDSGNGVLAAFDLDTLEVRWRVDQDHGGHLLLYEDSGELVTGDHADVVVRDVATGAERARADNAMGIQSVLFPCPGEARDFYVVTFLGVSRVVVAPAT